MPDDVQFATKPELARLMLGRALDAGQPAAWVTADEAYCRDGKFRAWLEQRRACYVVAVDSTQAVPGSAVPPARTPAGPGPGLLLVWCAGPGKAGLQAADLRQRIADHAQVAGSSPAGMVSVSLRRMTITYDHAVAFQPGLQPLGLPVRPPLVRIGENAYEDDRNRTAEIKGLRSRRDAPAGPRMSTSI